MRLTLFFEVQCLSLRYPSPKNDVEMVIRNFVHSPIDHKRNSCMATVYPLWWSGMFIIVRNNNIWA